MIMVSRMDNNILEGQLRECYGRVVYTHKTHEKCADILQKKTRLHEKFTVSSFSNNYR